MKASEMIATIKYVEENHHDIKKMYASRIKYFQRQNRSETQGVTYDEPAFSDFITEMEREVKKVNIPTAKKILNNWYLWAKNNLQALSKTEPFVKADNAIDWLIKNNFRVDHKCFAESATEAFIDKVKEQMPQSSELYAKLKSVADKNYVGKRGFSYPYLIKVVAGFSEAWN
jgi:hypothetical protein